MKREEWRYVVGYEGLYMVSNFGRVKSLNYRHTGKEHMLKPHKVGKYLQVTLHKDGMQKGPLVHDLVAIAFQDICGDWFEGAQVNHKDENPENNCAWNLEWCTASYNTNYGTRTERAKLNKPDQSVPVYQFDLDGNLVHIWCSVSEAAKNGYALSAISSCCHGKRKTHKKSLWSYYLPI